MLRANRPNKFLPFFIPLALSAIFLLDILGPFDPVVSVMYGPIILLSTWVFSKGGIVYVGFVCVVLTSASFILSGVEGFNSMNTLQFMAIIVAIVVTTSLSFRLSSRHDYPPADRE